MSDEVLEQVEVEAANEEIPEESEFEAPASPQEIAAAAALYSKICTDDVFPSGPAYPHAGNIAKKLKDHHGQGTSLATTIDETLKQYCVWRKRTRTAKGNKSETIASKVKAFDEYTAFLDTPEVDEFDSRGALVSSALEEFCHYLLEPITSLFPTALLGKNDTYQGLYFTAVNFKQLLKLPTAHTPVNTLDFVIGAHLKGAIKGEKKDEEFDVRLPAVAVECKGYLDRPRFIESQNMARAIKSSFPQCQYILVAQTLKLNLKKIGIPSEIDGIYVWRRMQNVDRKERRRKNIPLKPIHAPAVEHFYDRVHTHLTSDWQLADPFGSGVLK